MISLNQWKSENTYRSSEFETFSPTYSQPQKASRTVSLDGVQIKTNSTTVYFADWDQKWANNLAV